MGFGWEEYGILWEEYGILREEYGISHFLAFKSVSKLFSADKFR
jgi:hypothetical protein